MAGRPTKARTIEEIGAKLEPWALPYLYLPELEARRDFLVTERAKILTSEPSLFAELPQNEYTDIIVQLSIQGATHPAFEQLPEPVKEKFAGLNCQEPPLEHRLRHPFREYLHPKEGHEKEAKYFLNGMYNATKFINLYYKWVLTPPNNGRPNFYSCFINKEYPWELNKLFKDNLVLKCDMIVHFSNMSAIDDRLKNLRIPKKQEEVFAYIKESTLNFIKSCEEKGPDRPAPYFNPRIDNLQKLGILEDIEKALEAVTWEDVNTRPSTRREPPLFTGAYEEVINGIHSPSVNAIATLSEGDKRKEFNGQVYYTNEFCNLVLRSDGIEKLNKVPNHKIMRATLSIGFSKHGKSFFKSGEIVLPKDEFLFRMGLTPEQAKDPIYKRGFCRDLSKQLQELLHFTLEVKNDIALAGGHIIDYCNTIGDTVTIRMGKECLNILVKHKKIAYVPNTVYANRIPDNKRLEYFLLVYLEDIYTNKYIQAREQDTIKVSTILEHLNNYGVVDNENRKYKEKVIDRFIEALDYLQNVNKSIEYYFTTSQDSDAQAIEGPELEKYKSKANFSKLYLWFSCKPLEEYRNEEEAKKIMAEKALRKEESKKRQERARDRKLGELEAERIDKAREKAEAEAQAKAQSDQSQGKTLDEYFKGNQ
jgi:hypothetical protein